MTTPTTNIEMPPTNEDGLPAATPVTIETVPVTPPPADANNGVAPEAKQGWIEEIEIAGSQLVERVKELVSEGNVRRLVVRTAEDRVLLEIPLTAGVAVGGVVTIFAPVLAALGALAALIAHVKVQIIRTDDTPDA